MLKAEIHREIRNGYFTLFVLDKDHDFKCLHKGSYHNEEEALDRLRQEGIESVTEVIRYY